MMWGEMTVDKLKEKARELGIPGFSNMKKTELVEAIEKKHAPADPQPAADNQASESSSEKNDYQEHPKFAKFNSQGSEAP